MSTRTMADFISTTSLDDMPPEVIAKAKASIQDHIGDMLAARGDKAVAAATRVATGMGGHPEATLLEGGKKVPCNLAAMVNAIMAGTLDLDDGAFRSIGHLSHAGRVIVPACLAVAESRKAGGMRLIEATVVAYETCLRAAWAVRLWDKNAVTEFIGAYGAVAGAAKLLGLSSRKTIHALGIAEAHCLHHSRARFLRKAAMTKDAAGWAAMTGVTAALLAKAGMEGPASVFDLPEGREVLVGLGHDWEIMRLYFKPYSSCRNNHGAVDAVLDLMKIHRLKAADIQRVTVGVASSPVRNTSYYRPLTTYEAQFSIPFIVGAALAEGAVGPAQIAPARLRDNLILEQADKVEVVADSEADAMWPGELPGRVKMELLDGRTLIAWVPHPLGSPENPLSKQVLKQKFIRLSSPAVGRKQAAGIAVALENLEDLKDISRLVEQLT